MRSGRSRRCLSILLAAALIFMGIGVQAETTAGCDAWAARFNAQADQYGVAHLGDGTQSGTDGDADMYAFAVYEYLSLMLRVEKDGVVSGVMVVVGDETLPIADVARCAIIASNLADDETVDALLDAIELERAAQESGATVEKRIGEWYFALGNSSVGEDFYFVLTMMTDAGQVPAAADDPLALPESDVIYYKA